MNFPDPPHVGFVTQYFLESAWVIGGVLLGTAGLFGFVAFRDGRWDRLKAVAIVGLLGAGVLALGAAVTTSGEHAAIVARALVDDAAAGRVQPAMSHFAPDAILSIGSPRNEGVAIDSIRRGIESLQREYQVESNRITQLDAYTISAGEARVDLACTTSVSGGGLALTTWTLKVKRQPDGSWKVQQITWLSINRNTPSLDLLW